MSQAIKRLGRVLNFMKGSGRGCLSLFAAFLFTEIVLERLDQDLAFGHRTRKKNADLASRRIEAAFRPLARARD